MKIIKNNFTYSINSNDPADVLFQDITECSDFLDGDNFEQVVFLVPFCDEPDAIRAQSKAYRSHYGPGKFQLLDLDVTTPIYIALRSAGHQASTEATVTALLKNAGYVPPKDSAS